MSDTTNEYLIKDYLKQHLSIRLTKNPTSTLGMYLRLKVELVLEGEVIDHDSIDIDPADLPEA